MPPKRRKDKGSPPSANTATGASKRKPRAPATSSKDIPLQTESPGSSPPSTPGLDAPSYSSPAADPTPIIIHGEKYYKQKDLARKGKTRQKTSDIWDRGYEIVRVEDGLLYFYCCICLDEKENLSYNPSYKPLRVNGMSSVHAHFKSKHGNECPMLRGSRSSSRAPTASPALEFVFKSSFKKFKFLLVRWIVFAHISFFQLENRYFQQLMANLGSVTSVTVMACQAWSKSLLDK